MTDSIKYSLAALGLIILLFLYNSSSQKSLEMDGQAIFNGNEEEVFRIKLSEDKKEIELIKTDTTWSFSNNDSLVVKENQVDKIFDRLLKVEKEILITSKEEKWEKFGVDDSLARHIIVYDEKYIHTWPVHPYDALIELIQKRNWEKLNIGVEMDSHYFTAYCYEKLKQGLPNAKIKDS